MTTCGVDNMINDWQAKLFTFTATGAIYATMWEVLSEIALMVFSIVLVFLLNILLAWIRQKITESSISKKKKDALDDMIDEVEKDAEDKIKDHFKDK